MRRPKARWLCLLLLVAGCEAVVPSAGETGHVAPVVVEEASAEGGGEAVEVVRPEVAPCVLPFAGDEVDVVWQQGSCEAGVQRLDAGEFLQAVLELDACAESAESEEEGVRAAFLAAWATLQARDNAEAQRRMSALVDGYPLLSDYAAFYAAQAAYQVRDDDGVMAMTGTFPRDSVLGAAASLLRVRAAWRQRSWGTVLAEANLHEALWGKKAELLYYQARLYERWGVAKLATRYDTEVLERWPESWVGRALRPKVAPSVGQQPSSAFRVGRRWVGQRQIERGVREFLRVAQRNRRGSPLWCEGHLWAAQALDRVKQRERSAPLYADAIAECEGTSWYGPLLFHGGESAFQRADYEASEAFLEAFLAFQAAPGEIAEALYLLAHVHGATGNQRDRLQALEALVFAHPDSKHSPQAAFLMFWDSFLAGDLSRALATVRWAMVQEIETDIRGRMRYWQARVEALKGDLEAAFVGYRAVLDDYPLSYYAVLSYSRLAEVDEGQAAAWLAEAVAAHHEQVRCVGHALVGDKAARAAAQGVELARLGRLELLEAHFEAALPGAEEDAMWLAAWLMHRKGAFAEAHRLVRRRVPDFVALYPERTGIRWHVAYPRPFADEVAAAVLAAGGVDADMVYAVMRQESGYRVRATSPADALGLMQVLPSTAQGILEGGEGPLTRESLYEPELNVRLGARYLSRLAERLECPLLVAAAYNAGSGRLCGWLERAGTVEADVFVESIPYRETRDYVRSVVRNYAVYRYLETGEMLRVSLTVPERCPGRR